MAVVTDRCEREQLPAADQAGARFLHFVNTREATVLDLLLREFLDRSYGQAHRLLGNQSEAEDAVQEAFLSLVRSCDRYNGSIPFAAWLGCLVHNAAVNAIRSRRLRTRHERNRAAADIGVGRTSEETESNAEQAIRAAVMELPERYRAAIDLHYFAGLSQGDTAKALGMNENAVAKRLQRARDYLRSLLKQRGVIVTSSLIVLALSSSPAQAASTAWITQFSASTLMPAAQHSSPALALSALPIGKASLAIGAVCMTLTVAGIWRFSPQDSQNLLPASQSRYQRSWDFNRDAPIDGILVVDPGKYHREAHGGVDNSGCLRVEGDSGSNVVLIFDVEPDRLPLHISFKVLASQAAEAFNASPFWDQCAKIAWFDRDGAKDNVLGKMVIAGERDRWFEFSVYVTKRSADIYINHQRSKVGYVMPAENAHFALEVSGNCSVDDLSIREISSGQVPDDIGVYLDAAEKISPDRQFGVVELPGFEKQRLTFMAIRK
jgi:RNA polymerase sigma factor (sigma-70 family)